MGFADDIKRFTVDLQADTVAVFVNTASAMHESIVNGSPVTGAPGQPVGQYGPGYHPGSVGGTLKASWQLEFLGPDEALISTNVPWAPDNEYGIRQVDGHPYTQRSSVGGRHSVALTIAGAPLLLADEARKLNAAGGTSGGSR